MHPEKRRHNEGAILILTLWVIALLSLMAQGVMFRVRLGVRENKRADLDLYATQLTHALSGLAVDRVAADDNTESDSYREEWGRTYRAESGALLSEYAGAPPTLADFELEIRPVDECGKVNLNFASQELLAETLKQFDAGAQSTEIAKAIIDWRDADNVGAAESDLYQSKTPPYAPSDRDFISVDELLFVNGVDAEMFFGEDANGNGFLDPNEDDGDASWPPDDMDGRLRPGLIEAFTAHGDGYININTARPEVLHAVMRVEMMNDPAAEQLADALLAKRRGEDGADGTDDDAPYQTEDELVDVLAHLLGEETPARARIVARPFGVSSNAFRFHLSVGFLAQHYARTSEIVLMREDGELLVLEYHDGR